MQDKKKIDNPHPERDFFNALKTMLASYDNLEDENISILKYPHSAFVKYFQDRIQYYFKESEIKPISFLHIPFEMAEGSREGINDELKNKYKRYIDKIIELHKEESDKHHIVEHLKSWKNLRGERVFDLDKNKHWKGWHISEEFENITREFEFAYSVARFASLCTNQKRNDTHKKELIKYFFNLISSKEIYKEETDDDNLKELRESLHQQYSKNIGIDELLNGLEYFNPHNLSYESMNNYFKWSVCLCAKDKEKPNLTFFKKVFLLGRLYKIHCYPITLLETSDSKINNSLVIKINALEQILCGKHIVFPKGKGIEEDWLKKIVFMGKKFPYKEIFDIFKCLPILLNSIEKAKNTGNSELLKINRKFVQDAQTKYPILDWVELDKQPDLNHRIFETILKLLCMYSTNPQHYNTIICNKQTLLLPFINESINQITQGNLPEVGLNKEEINESIVPDILALIGLVECFMYPVKISTELDISYIIDYLLNKNNQVVLEFRFRAIWGNIFKHPKIVKFITMLDFDKNLSWLRELGELCRVISPIISKETKRMHEDAQNIFASIKFEEFDDEKRKQYDDVKSELQKQEIRIQNIDKINSLSRQLNAQQGKIEAENS